MDGVMFADRKPSRRSAGDFEAARKWCADFVAAHPEGGPWHDAAQAELWLMNRTGPCPKQAIQCAQISTPPYLDGKLEIQGELPISLPKPSPEIFLGGRNDRFAGLGG